jgi:hypothetical protein
MFEQTFKNIDDVLWKEASCTTELDYTEIAQLPTWSTGPGAGTTLPGGRDDATQNRRFSNEHHKTATNMTDIENPHAKLSDLSVTRSPPELQLS